MTKPSSEPINASRIQRNPVRTRTPRIHARGPPTGGAPPSTAAFHRAPVSSDAWYWLACAPRGMNVTEYFCPPMCRVNDAFIPYHGQRSSLRGGNSNAEDFLALAHQRQSSVFQLQDSRPYHREPPAPPYRVFHGFRYTTGIRSGSIARLLR